MMRKNILVLGAIGLMSITACKKEETNSVTETSYTTTTVSGVEVPKFNNPEVQKFAEDYAMYISETVDAAKSGDVVKMKLFMAKSDDWTIREAELVS